MIRLLMQPVNLLIMDEPTNHLDMASKDVLKEAIKAFDGTAIIVSHDREFLDGLVDKVYAFSGGEVREHIGGIYDYLHEHNLTSSTQDISQKVQNGTSKNDGKEGGQPQSIISNQTTELSYTERKELQKKRSKLEKMVKESESSISELESKLEELDKQLQDVENASNMAMVEQCSQLQKKLDAEMDKWEQWSTELDKIII